MRNSNYGFGKCHHENGHPKPKLGRKIFPSLLLATAALISNLETQAQKRILFYGPTFKSVADLNGQPLNGVAEQLIIDNPGEFAQIGTGPNDSQVWTPGDATPALDWSTKTTADFRDFAAIVIEDLRFDPIKGWQHIRTPATWAGAIQNVNAWSDATEGTVEGNVLLFGGDPETHWDGCDPNHPCGGEDFMPGAKLMIEQGIRFAAAAYNPVTKTGTGLFIALSAVDPDLPSPVDPTEKCVGTSPFRAGNLYCRPHGK